MTMNDPYEGYIGYGKVICMCIYTHTYINMCNIYVYIYRMLYWYDNNVVVYDL